MPVPLFVHQPEYCPYGHSLAPGIPQKVSWLPCVCEPAREAGSQGRGLGHMTLWCGTCSAEDHRDSRFYEPPHQVGGDRSRQRLGDAAGRLSASGTTARATATATGWSVVWTVTMLMIFWVACAIMTLLFRPAHRYTVDG